MVLVQVGRKNEVPSGEGLGGVGPKRTRKGGGLGVRGKLSDKARLKSSSQCAGSASRNSLGSRSIRLMYSSVRA